MRIAIILLLLGCYLVSRAQQHAALTQLFQSGHSHSFHYTELGFRGSYQFLRWDITGFLLQCDNRFGTLAQTDHTGAFYTYRTNIGHSLTKRGRGICAG
ncbi:hypothetical protein [uncultured Chitinophaga sp.]|uniref:hypothetical protein n=1 Tax=uncultured Chitinophaga sp. TaxID=339340 RepID=UPI00262FC451|nr:hypothetical protein [uncultured Chitinophaga sp.]